jgi:hypothetical protein
MIHSWFCLIWFFMIAQNADLIPISLDNIFLQCPQPDQGSAEQPVAPATVLVEACFPLRVSATS